MGSVPNFPKQVLIEQAGVGKQAYRHKAVYGGLKFQQDVKIDPALPYSGLGESACLIVKNIGKPCAGKPQARFDEGGQGDTWSLLYLIFLIFLKVREWRLLRITNSLTL